MPDRSRSTETGGVSQREMTSTKNLPDGDEWVAWSNPSVVTAVIWPPSRETEHNCCR